MTSRKGDLKSNGIPVDEEKPESEYVENFLKALSILQKSDEPVKTVQLANHLGIAPASVTEMIQRLAKNGYISYKKYHGITFTRLGKEYADRVHRKHRIIECFLVEMLGFSPGEVHQRACRLEHAVDDKTEKILWEILGKPIHCLDNKDDLPPCPYYDKIIERKKTVYQPITSLKPNDLAKIKIIRTDSETFKMLEKLGIVPDCVFRVLSIKKSVITISMNDTIYSFKISGTTRILVEKIRQ